MDNEKPYYHAFINILALHALFKHSMSNCSYIVAHCRDALFNYFWPEKHTPF